MNFYQFYFQRLTSTKCLPAGIPQAVGLSVFKNRLLTCYVPVTLSYFLPGNQLVSLVSLVFSGKLSSIISHQSDQHLGLGSKNENKNKKTYTNSLGIVSFS